ncbi:hypothetical protein AALP_AAs60350U000100 [Arabis alpina]|uniref:Uncharacterized protein n=1 Tax=Arabis alpina TaxID=50452 RepID=A0A087G380_ARAAL|nr:hypothetical protein AALP_AAs60350U000100 [Arabis alpina]
MESNRETDPDKSERNDDFGDADKVITDELIGTADENADELIGAEELDDVDPTISTRRTRDSSFLPDGVDPRSLTDDEDPRSLPDDDDPRTMSLGPGRADDADVVGTYRVEAEVLVGPGIRPVADVEIVETHRSLVTDGPSFADDTDPNLPFGRADVSSFSSSSDSSAFSDEDDDEGMSVEVERTKKVKKVKKKAKPRVCPDPPGSSLSNERSLRRLRKSCGIPGEIVLVAPTFADRVDVPPAGYMTLFKNYFDQCLLWFPLPRFLMRYLAVHQACLAQINPRGIRHLLGIYVLSRECGADISTENLSYLSYHSVTNSSGIALIAGFPRKDDHFEYCFSLLRSPRGPSRRIASTLSRRDVKDEELSSGNGNWKRSFSRKRIDRELSAEILPKKVKHSVTNSSGMALIAGFPSKDDHFEYCFFFAEISERTVEADCIDLVKTRWERRVKPTMPKVSKEFLAAMHKELSSGNGNWKRSFSRKRIERALSAEILPKKVLGRGQARLSLREQISLEAAAKARGSSGTGAPRVAMPTTRARTSRPSAPKTALPPPSSGDVEEFRRLSAERTRISSGKGKGVDRVTPSKRQRADAFPAAAVSGEASASGGDVLLSDKAYSLSLLFDRLVLDYDEDVCSKGSELSAAKEANAALQSRLDEIVERNEALERDALALHKVKKDYEDKLSKLKSRCAKAEGETVWLRGELSSASDLQRSRIDAAIAEARDEMTRSFMERTSEVAGLIAEIGGKVQIDMLTLTEIDADLEFIGLLQGSDPPDLLTEVKTLHQRRHPIYDAHDVFADLLASVRRVFEIPRFLLVLLRPLLLLTTTSRCQTRMTSRRQATRALRTDLICLVFQT